MLICKDVVGLILDMDNADGPRLTFSGKWGLKILRLHADVSASISQMTLQCGSALTDRHPRVEGGCRGGAKEQRRVGVGG